MNKLNEGTATKKNSKKPYQQTKQKNQEQQQKPKNKKKNTPQKNPQKPMKPDNSCNSYSFPQNQNFNVFKNITLRERSQKPPSIAPTAFSK